MFVKDERIPVSLDSVDLPHEERNVIYIKPKLNFGEKARVTDALITVKSSGDKSADMEILAGTGNLALLTECIVAWSGPAFAGMACNAANIGRLDPDEPLVEAVLAEINRRNFSREAIDPKGLLVNGSAN